MLAETEITEYISAAESLQTDYVWGKMIWKKGVPFPS